MERCQHRTLDGFIITGAPVERLPFEEVRYWPELRSIFDWTQTHVHRSFTICWAAQAALYHFHAVPKRELSRKAFDVPVSRSTEVCAAGLPADRGLRVLADSDEAGVCLIEDPLHCSIHMFNHLEYDTGTLAAEYHRLRG